MGETDWGENDWGEATEAELIAGLRAAHHAAALAEYAQVSLIMAFYRHRHGSDEAGGAEIPLLDADLITEIGTLLRVTDQHASELVEIGLALQRQLPVTRLAFAEGTLDLERVRAIVAAITNQPPAIVADLDRRLPDYARNRPPEHVRRTARRWIAQRQVGG
jgi:hypothetical protein